MSLSSLLLTYKFTRSMSITHRNIFLLCLDQKMVSHHVLARLPQERSRKPNMNQLQASRTINRPWHCPSSAIRLHLCDLYISFSLHSSTFLLNNDGRWRDLGGDPREKRIHIQKRLPRYQQHDPLGSASYLGLEVAVHQGRYTRSSTGQSHDETEGKQASLVKYYILLSDPEPGPLPARTSDLPHTHRILTVGVLNS